jgi:hypothetical protein
VSVVMPHLRHPETQWGSKAMTRLHSGSFVLGVSVGLWATPLGLNAQEPGPKVLPTPSVQWAVGEDFVSNAPHAPEYGAVEVER